MPLAGIDDLIANFKGSSNSELAPVLRDRKDSLFYVKDDFFSVTGDQDGYPRHLTRTMATADVRAFFSLVLTYAKGSNKYQSNSESPKMISSIMPRTDFSTMYRMISPKIKSALDCQSLFDILEVLATFDGKGGVERDRNYKLETATLMVKSTPVSAKAWIEGIERGQDLLTKVNKAVWIDGLSENPNAGLGGLGSTVEGIASNPAVTAPIFEFREILAPFGLDAIKPKVTKMENEIVRLHASHAIKRAASPVLDERAASETAKSCSRCKKGQAQTGKDGDCQDCPAGKVPSDDQKTCIDEKKCGPGQAKTGANDECQKCAEGKKPSDDGKTCVDDKSCGDGEAKTGTNGACQKCPDGKKPSGDGKTCVDKPDDKDKDKDKDKEKKTARTKWCLAFVAGSGLIGGAEALHTDEGVKALEDSANDLLGADAFKKLDYTLDDSNVNVDVYKGTSVPEQWLNPEGVDAYGRMVDGPQFPDFEHDPIIHHRRSIFDLIARAIRWIAEGIKIAVKAAASSGMRVGKTDLRVSSPVRAGASDAKKLEDLSKLPSAERASKAKDAIKKVREDKSFIDCLAMAVPAAGLVVADATLHVENVPNGGFKADNQTLSLILFKDEDDIDQDALDVQHGQSHYWITYPDAFWHENRIIPGTCQSASELAGTVSAFQVDGGCCSFYADDKCESPMFKATNREDMNLKGRANDHIRSFSCVHDLNCEGTPNPMGYAKGACGLHIVQYQSSEPGKVPIDFSVDVLDSRGQAIFELPRTPAPGDLLTFGIPKLKFDMKIDVSPATINAEKKGRADYAAKFTIGKDSFWSDDDARCHFGDYDGWSGHPGRREGDCGFTCS